MSDDDSFNDSDEIFNLYSSKKVAETFHANLQKLVSKRVCSVVGERSEDVLNSAVKLNEKSKISLGLENFQLLENNKARHVEESPSSISDSIELSSEDSIDIIDIVEKQPQTSTRKSTRGRKRGKVVCDLDYSPPTLPESTPPRRRKTSKSRSKKTAKVIEEIVLDDSFEPIENLDEDELNPEVTVKVIWKSVGLKKFQIRKFQKMSKIFEELSREENIPEEKIVLTFNNIKVKQHDTPDSLNLQIYHFIHGGVLSESTNSFEPSSAQILNNGNNSVALKFRASAKDIVKLILNKDEKMKIGMIKYAEQLEVPLGKIKFFFDGEPLNPSETPISLGLEGDEIIDVKISL